MKCGVIVTIRQLEPRMRFNKYKLLNPIRGFIYFSQYPRVVPVDLNI